MLMKSIELATNSNLLLIPPLTGKYLEMKNGGSL